MIANSNAAVADGVLSERLRSPRKTSLTDSDESIRRAMWGTKMDFLLSIIGFVVDLGNIWRFPYLCYKYGGGAFLIPYVIMWGLAGVPLFYMELAIGQYNKVGAISIWEQICPLFKGIGYAMTLIALYVDLYYNVMIAWSLYLFFDSFADELPWLHCNNSWNTPLCKEAYQWQKADTEGHYNNSTSLLPVAVKAVFPTEEYFERAMLQSHKGHGLEELGSIRWELALCLLTVYLLSYFSLWKGITVSGKGTAWPLAALSVAIGHTIVWLTALSPYAIMVVLLVRSITLDGAGAGVLFYITPNLTHLRSSEVWSAAASQVYFSLGPGFGVLLTYASYNNFHNNVYSDALITSVINSLTSLLAGFVIFAILGHMSSITGQPIETVVTSGPNLVYAVYPEAISRLPGSSFWNALFFTMLFMLGIDSSFAGSETIITAMTDEFPMIRKKRKKFIAFMFTIYFVVGMYCCTQSGKYLITLLDENSANISLLIVCFFETVAVSWFYGIERFVTDIKEMVGFTPGLYWRICWKFVAPVFLLANITVGFMSKSRLQEGDYIYPDWAEVVGWFICASSVLCIPGVAIYKLVHKNPGHLYQKYIRATTPLKDRPKRADSSKRVATAV